jgi:hypothetical protein
MAVNCDVNVDLQQNPVIVQALFEVESVAPVAALSVSGNEGGQVTALMVLSRTAIRFFDVVRIKAKRQSLP